LSESAIPHCRVLGREQAINSRSLDWIGKQAATQPTSANSQFFGRNYQAARPTAPQLPGMKRETANIDIRVEPTEGYTWRVE